MNLCRGEFSSVCRAVIALISALQNSCALMRINNNADSSSHKLLHQRYLSIFPSLV